MSKSALAGFLLVAMVVVSGDLGECAIPIPVLILDGQSGGPYHDWRNVTPVLKKQLEEAGLFRAER